MIKSRLPIRKISILNVWITGYMIIFGLFTLLVNGGIIHNEPAINLIIGAILLLANAYTNLGILIYSGKRPIKSRLVLKKKVLGMSYVLNYIIYVAVGVISAWFMGHPFRMSSLLVLGMACILLNTLILAFQNYVILYESKTNADLENSRLRAANADAANQLLRQQIHPHFLFNALNILKSLYKVNPQAGEKYLIRLSDFLRAVVSGYNTRVIPLKDELKLCDDYLEMQKIRFGEALQCVIRISEENLRQGFVPSFSIQPLIENAIKHNELTEESPLLVQISDQDGRICVSNNIKIKVTTEVTSQSGLANLSERLKLISGEDLLIENTPVYFSVSFKILSSETTVLKKTPLGHG